MSDQAPQPEISKSALKAYIPEPDTIDEIEEVSDGTN